MAAVSINIYCCRWRSLKLMYDFRHVSMGVAAISSVILSYIGLLKYGGDILKTLSKGAPEEKVTRS